MQGCAYAFQTYCAETWQQAGGQLQHMPAALLSPWQQYQQGSDPMGITQMVEQPTGTTGYE